MNSNTNQIAHEIRTAQDIRDEMDLKITDARAMLAAIEALFAHSAVEQAGRYGVSNCDIHNLVLIALDKAREAESLISDLEFAIRQPSAQHKTEGETALSADEATFLASYRNCSENGQKAIRQLALAARDGLPTDFMAGMNHPRG